MKMYPEVLFSILAKRTINFDRKQCGMPIPYATDLHPSLPFLAPQLRPPSILGNVLVPKRAG